MSGVMLGCAPRGLHVVRSILALCGLALVVTACRGLPAKPPPQVGQPSGVRLRSPTAQAGQRGGVEPPAPTATPAPDGSWEHPFPTAQDVTVGEARWRILAASIASVLPNVFRSGYAHPQGKFVLVSA